MIAALRQSDQVFLVDEQGFYKDEYLSIKRELENHNLIVGNEVVQASSANPIPAIKAHATKREKIEHLIYEPTYISKKNPVNVYGPKVEFRHLRTITLALEKEIKELKAKKDPTLQPRIEWIQKTISDLNKSDKNNSLTYQQMHGQLDHLQDKLLSKNTFVRFLEKHSNLFGNKTLVMIRNLQNDAMKAESSTPRKP